MVNEIHIARAPASLIERIEKRDRDKKPRQIDEDEMMRFPELTSCSLSTGDEITVVFDFDDKFSEGVVTGAVTKIDQRTRTILVTGTCIRIDDSRYHNME